MQLYKLLLYKDKEIIKRSGLFDEEFYLSIYQDVKFNNINPIEHYLIFGWKEGRDPSLKFDTKFYLDYYADVRNAGINPLLHYIIYGRKEGRDTFAKVTKCKENVKFIIYAPNFDENSGGIMVLHRLCDLLNKQGEQAYIWLWPQSFRLGNKGIYKKFNTPLAKIYDLDDNAIVVYPEVVSGNPLKAKNVVRWLLYKPGFFTGEVNYGKDELFFYFQKEHIPPEFNIPDENRLFIGLSFLDVYKQTNFGARKGTCYILRKGKNRKIAHNIKNSILIDGKSHKEIVEIFNNVKCCISYDLYTAYSNYAAICGCKSIVIPEEGLTRDKWVTNEEYGYGIAYGFNDLNYAEKTKDKLFSQVQKQEKENEELVRKFIYKCKTFFKLNGNKF